MSRSYAKGREGSLTQIILHPESHESNLPRAFRAVADLAPDLVEYFFSREELERLKNGLLKS